MYQSKKLPFCLSTLHTVDTSVSPVLLPFWLPSFSTPIFPQVIPVHSYLSNQSPHTDWDIHVSLVHQKILWRIKVLVLLVLPLTHWFALVTCLGSSSHPQDSDSNFPLQGCFAHLCIEITLRARRKSCRNIMLSIVVSMIIPVSPLWAHSWP